MRRVAVLSSMVWVLAGLSLGGASATAGVAPAQVVTLSPEEELAQELANVATRRGWTDAEAAARYHAAETIGAIAEQVARERPNVFVGSAVSAQPGGAPTLYVKGPADKFIRDMVDASDIEVILADNQPFSFDELEARKLRVHHALEAMGFRNVVTAVNISGAGRIPAMVAIEPGRPSGVAEVLAALPADLRSSVELTMSETPIGRDTTSFGGMLVTTGGASYATSGWSVRNASGVTGVTTAGHASGADGIVHPGDGTHSFVFQAEHRGQWGDIEWHTTNVAEVDDYYSTATTIADVVSVEPRANISVGEGVCQYGRFSNSQDCTLDVFDVSLACTLGGVFNDRLVQMSAITSVPGDSGGPWFSAGRAYGSQKGWCGNKDTFSVADLFDEALGVTVMTN